MSLSDMGLGFSPFTSFTQTVRTGALDEVPTVLAWLEASEGIEVFGLELIAHSGHEGDEFRVTKPGADEPLARFATLAEVEAFMCGLELDLGDDHDPE